MILTKRQRQALKLAIECMQKENKTLAVDANLAHLQPATVPDSVKRRAGQYIEIAKAMGVIEEMLMQKDIGL